MQFWNTVERLLKERGMSVRGLAREIGLTPGAVSKYARGTLPGLEVAKRIADTLGVSLDYLATGSENLAPKPVCPAPVDHQTLKTLTTELGLQDLVLMSKLGSQWIVWEIWDVLIMRHPDPVRLEDVVKALPTESEAHVRGALEGLARGQLVIEETDSDGTQRYRLEQSCTEFKARDLGNASLHVKRAVRKLFMNIMPALGRNDGSAGLITMTAEIPGEQARAMLDDMKALIKERGRYYAEMTGNTRVDLVFSIAIDDNKR